MDLDAILARRPADRAGRRARAHQRARQPPSRSATPTSRSCSTPGIDVYTTVNIQHLESLNDVVAQITGVRVRETVPDGILDRADEMKLIDLSPEELIQRLARGQGLRARAGRARARATTSRPGNLTALRELALRQTAEHVDDQMQAYMRAHAVAGTWAVTERIMVA